MKYVGVMCGGEPRAELPRKSGQFALRQWTAPVEPVLQGFAFEQFHRKEAEIAIAHAIKDAANVGMCNRAGGQKLAHIVNRLDCDPDPWFEIESLIDPAAHPAVTDETVHAVAIDENLPG